MSPLSCPLYPSPFSLYPLYPPSLSFCPLSFECPLYPFLSFYPLSLFHAKRAWFIVDPEVA